METFLRNQFLLPLLVLALGLSSMNQAAAQTFSNLYSFDAANGPSSTNTYGAYPYSGVIFTSTALYGTSGYGGASGNGTVYKMNIDGTVITNLHIFSALSGSPATNSDGSRPQGQLMLGGSNLYGTTSQGGRFGYGGVFTVKTDGTGFSNFYSFTPTMGSSGTNYEGAYPEAGLILSGSNLYGTATYGGAFGRGTVFAISTNGTGITNLHSFNGNTNDGNDPQAGLFLSSNTLFGTTLNGGAFGGGVVFALGINGAGYTNVHNFGTDTNEGTGLFAGVVVAGGFAYGTTYSGGSGEAGVVFKVSTNGTGYANLHSFTTPSGGFPPINSDGNAPQGGVILSGGTVYGMTGTGGIYGYGTEYAVNTDSTGFTNLHYNGYEDGYYGAASLTLAGNILYGTDYAGGQTGSGTVFSLTLPAANAPLLTITRAGTNVVLTWPTNATGYILESATNLIPSAVWNTNYPAPAVVGGQNTLTNPALGKSLFYRLTN